MLIDNMHIPLKILIKGLNKRLVGYYRYYVIINNSKSINSFKDCVISKLFKVLNRRSKINSYNWNVFNERVDKYKLTSAKIYVNLFQGIINISKKL